ncbi:hypothetical protein C8F04DRAFT_1251757 [Mycena alexandri]|uniref:Uncharacterized protein n=1 Tax=Mycena alexandri TaxID=1745969 RepID=A0AAD6TAS8_9AGAR|nr:hypothetical protein C8F04DRAFT_1251757 [Mycena alexandri]
MRFTVFFAPVGLVSAADDRLLFAIPSGDSIDTFTSKHQPAIDADLTLVDIVVEAGDFSGNNADTEARLVCAWTDGTTVTTLTNVATSMTFTPGCLGPFSDNRFPYAVPYAVRSFAFAIGHFPKL